jgi:hypothetical protein
MRKNEIMSFKGKYMKLGNIMLRFRKTNQLYFLSYSEFKSINTKKQKSRNLNIGLFKREETEGGR